MSWVDWFLVILIAPPLSAYVGDYWGCFAREMVAGIKVDMERFRSWREGRRRV